MPPYWFKPSSLGPSAFSAASGAVVGNASQFTCLRQRQASALDRYKYGRPPIVDLCAIGSPDAVSLLITFVIIDALYRMLWRWTPPHVCKELAIVIPFLACGDPSLDIVWVGRASSPHVRPRSVFRRRFAVPGFSVNGYGCPVRAAATNGVAGFQIAGQDVSLGPAIASAKPDGSQLSGGVGEVDHEQPSITPARQVLMSLSGHQENIADDRYGWN